MINPGVSDFRVVPTWPCHSPFRGCWWARRQTECCAKGDVITRISCTETKNITHQQAADLFNSAGNQIAVQLKRAGVQSAPVASASTSAPLVNGSPVPTPVPVPVSGGVPLPGIANPTLARSENPAVKALPKTQFSLKTHFAKQQKPQPTNLDTLSIQTQPYRTLPLLQPSAKPRTDLGVSTISHLGTQEDYFTMPKEPQYVPLPQAATVMAKQDEFLMKQKVRRPFEATLASVVSVGEGEGEEERGAAPRRRLSPVARRGDQGGQGIQLRDSSANEGNEEDKSKKSKKKDANTNVKKINKCTFKIGGEIVQLKKPPENSAMSSDDAPPQIQLRKHSAGNLLTVGDSEREEQVRLASRSAKGRSRSLGYTVYTTQLEEHSDEVLLTADSVLSLPPHPETDQSEQAVECTLQLAVPPVEPEVSSVEVEHTIKLPHPKPMPQVQSVNVSETVRVKRDYYMW
ncbi:hypothetical protein O3P69_020771 [Scylla paramamosain]|uniref:Uncharacterized protein n=1 Tax=Scylla paramamosain TaxID=85552 RepID=A0AAW0TMT8_SCYPA